MRKRVFGRQLSRERDSRRALFRSLVKSLVENGSINTTRAKAKAVQPFVDKLVNLGKKDTVDTRRKIYAKLGNDRKTADAIAAKVASGFKKRKSGFTRIINLPQRRGDLAKMVRLEWVKDIEEKKSKKGEKKKDNKK